MPIIPIEVLECFDLFSREEQCNFYKTKTYMVLTIHSINNRLWSLLRISEIPIIRWKLVFIVLSIIR